MNKQIQKKFKSELTIIDFYEAAHLDDKRKTIYSERRRGGERYAHIIIHGCQHPNWWYAPFVGIECFVRLRFNNYGRGEFVTEGVLVYLTNTRVLSGRSINSKDFTII